MKKISIIIVSIILCITLCSCSNSNQQQINLCKKLNFTIDKINESVKNIESISNAELQISDIVSDEDLSVIVSIPFRRNESTRQIVKYSNYIPINLERSNNTLNNYFKKIEDLHSNVSNTINANTISENTKQCILDKALDLRNILSDVKSGNILLTDKQCKSIEDLTSNINTYIGRINMTKNEAKNEFLSLKKFKQNYSNNIESLSSKYIRLANCLDSRTLYYTNILTCLNNVCDCIIYSNTYLNNTQNIVEANNTASPDIYYFKYIYKNGNWHDLSNTNDNNDDNEEDKLANNEIEPVLSKKTNIKESFNPYYNDYYYGYYGNGMYGRNINTYRAYRNINSMDKDFKKQKSNIDNFKIIERNIDSFGKEQNKLGNARNLDDPYKVIPTEVPLKDTKENFLKNNSNDLENLETQSNTKTTKNS